MARIPGTPLIRVRAYSMMGDIRVGSAGAAPEVRSWRRWIEKCMLPGLSRKD